MQTKREKSQSEMMLLPSMEERIPESYYLRRLNRVLDLSFVHEAVRDKYCQDNGRPSIDPEVIVRLMLLLAITGRSSVRGLMQEVDLHLGYRWFIGYGPSEALPDHSTLSKALDRFGDEVFNELFRRSVEQCEASGLTGGKVMHVDATTIRADIDKDRVRRDDSSDRDARFGRFPDGTIQPGYKQQTVVDGVFAEGQQWHGLRRAWRRGLSNMKVQSLIVMTVLNLKRLAACLPLISGLNWLWKRLQTLIESYIRLLGSFVVYYRGITPYAR
jgi:transposase